MLSRLSRNFHNWTKGWLIIVLFTVLVVYIVITLPILQKLPGGDIVALDAQLFYPPDKAFETVASYGDSARLWTRLYLTWDVVTPILYTLAFGLSISWLFQRGFKPESKMQNLNLIPVGAGLFDLLENINIVILMSLHPKQPVGIAWLSTVCTMMKICFLAISILLIMIGLIMATIHGFKKQKPATD